MIDSYERGRVEELLLNRKIVFNGEEFNKVRMEIDHINYGLDPTTFKLKKKKRSNFSPKQVAEFVKLLDGEWLIPQKKKATLKIYAYDVYSPLRDSTSGKKFRMVFSIKKDHKGLIGMVTLHPLRR